jgi:hypothetical protein
MLGRRLIQCVVLLGCFCSTFGVAHAASVLIVSSERSAGYLEAATSIVTELERGGLARTDINQWTIGDPVWLLPWGQMHCPMHFGATGARLCWRR